MVLRAWASSRLDFFRAKVVQVNHKLGSASIVWAGDNDDDDDEDVWENEEEELPLAYLRSISGHEDLTNAEPSSPHSPHSGGSKLEQRLSKAVEIRRTIGDAQAMSTTSGDYHHHSPTGRHASSPLADTPFPNELSGLLDEFAVRNHMALPTQISVHNTFFNSKAYCFLPRTNESLKIISCIALFQTVEQLLRESGGVCERNLAGEKFAPLRGIRAH